MGIEQLLCQLVEANNLREGEAEAEAPYTSKKCMLAYTRPADLDKANSDITQVKIDSSTVLIDDDDDDNEVATDRIEENDTDINVSEAETDEREGNDASGAETGEETDDTDYYGSGDDIDESKHDEDY